MTLNVRKGTLEDIPAVMALLKQSQQQLTLSGSPQWSGKDGPQEEEIRTHILNQRLYVFLIEDTLLGTAVMTDIPETAYDTITFGAWEKKEIPYLSIHRFAIAPEENGKGYAKLFLTLLLQIGKRQGYKDIRIDTHPVNHSMQRVILVNDFLFKGVIQLPIANGERYAYQWTN